ncbi:MAG: hypothetical protein JW936_04425 [Sedimentisphaerales bacterium]|nr:hypothetical protein [Sedimentisphaerales bacterium]
MLHKDTYLRKAVTIIAVMLFVLVVVIMHDAPTIMPVANAQGIPDSGAQLNQIIQELQTLQDQVAQINQTLSSGQITVQIAESDDNDSSNGRGH